MRDIYKKENSDTRSDNEDNRSVLLGMSVLGMSVLGMSVLGMSSLGMSSLGIFPELKKWVQYF
jgi:hypothetical protein